MSSNTVHFTSPEHSNERIHEVLDLVYMAYLMSGDPTYITSHMNARSAIAKVERDEIIEELVKIYISNIEF